MRSRSLVALLVLVTACARGRAADRPLRCPFDAAVVADGGTAGVVCGDERSDGLCGPECVERVRACVLGAVRAKEPFTARWVGNVVDGVVPKRAIVGRRTGDAYDVRWVEYTLVARCGPPDNCGDRTHEGWRARSCADVAGIDAACAADPNLPECALGRNDREERLGLACVQPRDAGSCED